MSCLDNIIGIDKRCSPETPSSGMYIQDLPGVTVKLADMAADEETESGVSLINQKITYAKDQILQDVREFLLPYMKVNSVLENDTVGYYHDNLETVAADVGYKKGIQIKIDHYPYLEFYINSIKLQSATSGATSIYIYNLVTGMLLDTISITTVADVPTEVTVQKAYKTDKQKLNLFIAIDGAATTYKSSLSYGQISANCTSCTGGYRNSYAVFNNIMISNASALIESNKRATTYTSGLSVNYSINCSVENFVCNMSNLFAWPILQKTGAELMRELMYSRRLNSIIVIDKTMNEKLREEFDAEYVKSMDRILKNISIPDDVCFKCRQKVKNVVRVP
jgi:hypothetical protein